MKYKIPFWAVLVLGFSGNVSWANNIITAEHPPIGSRGYALQFDQRPTFLYSNTFVTSNGTERDAIVHQGINNFIFRLFIPNWMFRVSTTYGHLEQNTNGRWGWGDTTMETGASREWGNARLRALLLTKAPTGNFDPGKPVNIGGGQWDLGPNLYLTQYLADKKIDLNLFSQYLFRFRNPYNKTKPGNELSYAMAAAYQIQAVVPVRVGLEHRALFGDTNSRDGHAVSQAKQALNIGPVMQINLSRFVSGFSIWPTMLFDFYNRNCARTQLYYLRINYNY